MESLYNIIMNCGTFPRLCTSASRSHDQAMDGRPPQAQPATGGTRASPIVSRVLSDGRLVELLYDEAERSTRFAIWTGAGWDYAASITGEGSEGLVPYSPTNSLLKNHIVLFPSEPIE